MQQNSGPCNSYIDKAGGSLVNCEIDLLHRFRIKGKNAGRVLCALVGKVNGIAGGFVRSEIGEVKRAMRVGGGTSQVTGRSALRHLEGHALTCQQRIFVAAIQQLTRDAACTASSADRGRR